MLFVAPIRRLSALVALAAFLGGGLVAPAVHRAAHGIEHAQARHAAAAQTDHVHTDGTGFTVALDGDASGHDLCLLCLPKQHTGGVLGATPSGKAPGSVFASPRSAAPATPAHALLPIRGPPTAA